MQWVVAAPPTTVLGINELAQLLLGQYTVIENRSPHHDLATAYTHVIAYPGYIVARLRYVRGRMSNYIPAWLRTAATGRSREAYFVVRYRLRRDYPIYTGEAIAALTENEFTTYFPRPSYPDVGAALLALNQARQ